MYVTPVSNVTERTRFSKVHVRLSSKFASKSSVNIPPHLTRIATLPCKISVWNNNARLKSAKLSHSKKLFKQYTYPCIQLEELTSYSRQPNDQMSDLKL